MNAHTHTLRHLSKHAVSPAIAFFFSCLNTLSLCPRLPSLCLSPSPHFYLSPSLSYPNPLYFFPAVTSRLAHVAAYVHMMLCLSTWVSITLCLCVFELVLLRSCIWKRESERIQRELLVCEVRARPCAPLYTHASV